MGACLLRGELFGYLEVAERPIVSGNPDYLEWIADETSSHDEERQD